ncbi:MAG: hypothetical protein F6K21_06485 [Symploca sp. SIO2D2]|nr:hypothetical protein [Symploca sp. SIO2D2]
MKTPLNEIALDSGSLTLTQDVLGNSAYAAVANGLKLSKNAELTGCSIPTPATANLLIVEGTLASFMGLGQTAVRLYLFEVASINQFTERQAIMLFTEMPAAVTAGSLIEQFCAAGETGALPTELASISALTLAEQTLLFSTLDYTSPAYQNPPFPPLQDAGAPPTFLQGIKSDLTAGYVFRASGQLQSSVTFPVPPDAPTGTEPYTLDISTALTAIGLGSLCTTSFSLNVQIALSSSVAMLNLLHPLNPPIGPSTIPLKPNFTQVGIGFPLGSGAAQVPAFEFDGTLTLGTNPTDVGMAFNPTVSSLSVMFTDLPDIADLESHFGSGVLSSSLGSFLPAGAMADLGTLELQELSVSIDCEALSVSALSLSVTTEKSLSLFDGIEVQPALISSFLDPFESYRTYDVQVAGKWFFKDTELDMVLVYDKGTTPANDQTLFFAQLALGTGINFGELATQLFHAEVSGLPLLVLSGAEVTAQRMGSGDTASESVSLELDVAAGWTLDGVDIDLEDLSLNISFAKASSTANWLVQEATAQGTLEIGPAFFYLSADYEPSDKSWTFSGGTLPGETENLGAFLTAVTEALGLEPPGDFLDPFQTVNVTGCYLQYQTSSTGSSNWQLTVSTDFQSGSNFHEIILNQIVLSFSRDGTGTSFSFDATTPASSTQGVSAVTDYLSSKLGVSVNIPESLTSSEILLKGLSASYNSATQNYNFVTYLNFGHSAFVQLNIDVVQLNIDVVSQTLGSDTTKDYYLGGTLIFNPGDTDEFVFNLDLVKSGDTSDLVASFHAESSKGITLNKLVQAIDPSAPNLDEFEIEIKDALFAHSGKKGSTPAKSLFAVDMGAAVNLSRLKGLPLIGHELKSLSSLDLAFQVVYGTGDYATTELQAINQILGNPSFRFPSQSVTAKKPAIATSMRVGGQQVIDMTVPVVSDSKGNLSATGGNLSTQDPKASNTGGDNGITWFPLNKAFGPMHMNRVGLAFDKTSTTITGYLDGRITVGTLSFDLLGLDVAVPLTGDSKFEPSFGLQGLGLNYQNGPVDIGGALFKEVANGETAFDGFVTISTESLEIGAVGSFAEMNDGKDSLFVYAVLGEPLGGPAFFFVTGLAAGFGYNRKLLPPPISQVQNFPLVTEAMTPSPQPQAGNLSGVHDYVAQKLALMQKDIVPTAGEYFLAAGVKFTSFELVEGFLLVVVQLGNEFRLDLLGLANASLPPDDNSDPVAEAQLAILAHYIPSQGSIWVQGQLTPNSFILSRHCHLTGGFALASWVSGAHSGEFVVSIGGYAPKYQTPEYYPKTQRVGFNWQVSGDLNVKGGGYFALVPHALMAGGSLHAVWHSGPVSAWFLMGANFLIEWKPFHYSADIYVDLGAKLTIHFFGTHHVSIDVIADLNVWGPEFGGHARITVKVIGIHFHFSINFGDSSSTLPPLKWEEFQDSFLPKNREQWLGVTIQGGLMRTVTVTLDDGSQTEVWIVKRDELNLTTSSALPVKSATFTLDDNAATTPAITPTTPGIAPMAVETIDTSKHSITITKVTPGQHSGHHGVGTAPPTEQLKLVPNPKKIPSGMWGHTRNRPLNPAPGEDVLDSVSGFSIVPIKEAIDDPAAITVARSSLAYETTQQNGFEWVSNTGSFEGSPSKWSVIYKFIEQTKSARSSALSKMGFENYKENFNQPLERDAPIPAQLGTWGS